jgi:hypothetical protein
VRFNYLYVQNGSGRLQVPGPKSERIWLLVQLQRLNWDASGNTPLLPDMVLRMVMLVVDGFPVPAILVGMQPFPCMAIS